MKDKKKDCPNFKAYINAKDEYAVDCHSNYCSCDDLFGWDETLNKRYQKVKIKNKAGSGKFFK